VIEVASQVLGMEFGPLLPPALAPAKVANRSRQYLQREAMDLHGGAGIRLVTGRLSCSSVTTMASPDAGGCRTGVIQHPRQSRGTRRATLAWQRHRLRPGTQALGPAVVVGGWMRFERA